MKGTVWPLNDIHVVSHKLYSIPSSFQIVICGSKTLKLTCDLFTDFYLMFPSLTFSKIPNDLNRTFATEKRQRTLAALIIWSCQIWELYMFVLKTIFRDLSCFQTYHTR